MLPPFVLLWLNSLKEHVALVLVVPSFLISPIPLLLLSQICVLAPLLPFFDILDRSTERKQDS